MRSEALAERAEALIPFAGALYAARFRVARKRDPNQMHEQPPLRRNESAGTKGKRQARRDQQTIGVDGKAPVKQVRISSEPGAKQRRAGDGVREKPTGWQSLSHCESSVKSA